MKKKEYLQPAIETAEMEMNELVLAGSVTDIDTPELGDDELLPPDIVPGLNPWESGI